MSDDGRPADAGATLETPRSLSRDAWFDLRRNPVFWIASAMDRVS